MRTNYTREFADGCDVFTATKNALAEETSTGISPNPAPRGIGRDTVPTPTEALNPHCPNPVEGFQALSKYLVEHMVSRVMHHMKVLCKEHHIALDMNYWKQQTRFILSSQTTEEILVISSPAGSGKSTWIEAFMLTLTEMFREKSALADSLVGVAVVLQKVEDLNRLASVLNHDAPQDNPNMVALQGWSQSGKELGFCQNPAVSCFDECRANSCTHAQTCDLLAFRRQAPRAPIIGLTQERFVMLRESGSLNSILYRVGEDGSPLPRRYLIFDEKYQMAQLATLDKPCIDRASIELSGLIEKIDATDSRIRSLQQSLSYNIDRPFQELRKSLRAETDRGVLDIQAGFCTLSGDDCESGRKFSFQQFSDSILTDNGKYATANLRTALTVMSALHSGQECLFSKTNGFSITCIDPPPLQYGESQSIIFDATAEKDEDYCCLQNAKFSGGTPQCSERRLIFHSFTHRGLSPSKGAMNSDWKRTGLSRFIAELIEEAHAGENIFLCSYKDFAEDLAQKLKEAMPPEHFSHILLMPGRTQETIPYFGGTNGSNLFNTATTVFMLGYPRLNPRDYLIHACAAYGADQISEELSSVPLDELTSKHSDFVWNLPSVKRYMAHHLAARMEQEIYRCKLRNPDFDGEINVYFFCPPADMMEILCRRLSPDETIYHDELPLCVDACKRSARRYKKDLTGYGRLVQFLSGWDGTEMPVQQLRADLDISPAVWKDLMKEDRVRALLEQHQVQRKGRGPNASWRRPDRQKCA